jgi:hypothetical protein
MNNQFINKLFLTLQHKMLSDLGMNEYMSHPGDKGDATELDWQRWFEIYLPKRYSVTKGKVVDCQGNESDQIDIIIYDRQYSPLVFHYNNVTYVTAESVYAVFEVKQDLTKEHIKYAAQKAKSVRSLQRTSAKIVYSTGLKEPKPLHHIISGLLTTKSSWKNTEAKIKENTKSLSTNEEIDIICSLNSISSRLIYETSTSKEGDLIKSVSISRNEEDNILMHLFLTILTQLQIIGTVPAIEFDKYFNDIPSLEEIYNDITNKTTN